MPTSIEQALFLFAALGGTSMLVLRAWALHRLRQDVAKWERGRDRWLDDRLLDS